MTVAPDDLIEALTQHRPNNTHSLEMRIDGLIASLRRLGDTRSKNAEGNDDSCSVHVTDDNYDSIDVSGNETPADGPLAHPSFDCYSFGPTPPGTGDNVMVDNISTIEGVGSGGTLEATSLSGLNQQPLQVAVRGGRDEPENLSCCHRKGSHAVSTLSQGGRDLEYLVTAAGQMPRRTKEGAQSIRSAGSSCKVEESETSDRLGGHGGAAEPNSFSNPAEL